MGTTGMQAGSAYLWWVGVYKADGVLDLGVFKADGVLDLGVYAADVVPEDGLVGVLTGGLLGIFAGELIASWSIQSSS